MEERIINIESAQEIDVKSLQRMLNKRNKIEAKRKENIYLLKITLAITAIAIEIPLMFKLFEWITR